MIAPVITPPDEDLEGAPARLVLLVARRPSPPVAGDHEGPGYPAPPGYGRTAKAPPLRPRGRHKFYLFEEDEST